MSDDRTKRLKPNKKEPTEAQRRWREKVTARNLAISTRGQEGKAESIYAAPEREEAAPWRKK